VDLRRARELAGAAAEDRLLEGVAAVGAGGGAAGLLHAREGGLHDGLGGQREGDVDAIAAVALHGGGESAGPTWRSCTAPWTR
jgi:hypothetical protein